MATKIPVEKKLRFIFTQDSFQLDIGNYSPSLQTQKQLYETNKYSALYNIGFQPRPDYFDQGGLFLHRLAELFIQHITSSPDFELQREDLELKANEYDYEQLIAFVPFNIGAEYVNPEWIDLQFSQLKTIYAKEVKAYKGSVKLYLQEKSQSLRIPEKIFFHLVENKSNDSGMYPFAFLATYSTRNEKNQVRHMPLQYALTEFKTDRKQLLELLACLSKAAGVSPIISEFMEKGELFHPLQLTSNEAYEFLCDTYKIEESGIVCRIPNWWKKKSHSPSVTMKVGENKDSLLGLNSLLSIQPKVEVDGMSLTKEDIEQLLAMSEGLTMIKGKWVEVNHKKLQSLLEMLDKPNDMITLREALSANYDEEKEEFTISNGTWLTQLFNQLAHPHLLADLEVPEGFHATLRPYQKDGYKWLTTMHQLQLGTCLADDMGLGKTIQVLAYLNNLYVRNPDSKVLLVVPASLLGNWINEAHKFAPDLPITMLHSLTPAKIRKMIQEGLSFITLTTYGMASKIEELADIEFDTIILDEAQAIKNPGTKQTKSIKALKGKYRIALTGTPIENDLSNLWSLFDFLNQGLLGTPTEFKKFANNLEDHPEGYMKLKKMISPFMIRRLKTDRSIISDLPDKIEQIEYISLSKKQSLLYNEYLNDMLATIQSSEGIERKGLVLASLAKLKQICNHPSQYLGEGSYEPKDSGKFEMLKELCETIYEKRERVLIFTQYKEIIPALDDYLASIFTIRGLTLDGDTPVKKRNELVKQFQSDQYIPYMILSLKAGGTGLTLTKANHVIHFDRWWNPAVENQATDRAYRIGQKNNVIVHKFVCKGTLEEKINQLIESKQELAANIVGTKSEGWITELDNDELMNLLRLEG